MMVAMEAAVPLPSLLQKPCSIPRPQFNVLATASRSREHEPLSVHSEREIQGALGSTTLCRRSLLLLGVQLGTMGTLTNRQAAFAAGEVEVGSYLPPAESHPGFVQFRATRKDTPALRAGNVPLYEFIIPSTWKQQRVANILSGNYCQPKCAEPWIEVLFEGQKDGSVQVVAAPMIRLTNKPNAKIEELGTPERLMSALGPFVTGNTYDSENLVESSVKKKDGETFYYYTLESPYAKRGTHNLATATARGNCVLLFVVSANDAQWSRSEGVLRTILDSFKA